MSVLQPQISAKQSLLTTCTLGCLPPPVPCLLSSDPHHFFPAHLSQPLLFHLTLFNKTLLKPNLVEKLPPPSLPRSLNCFVSSSPAKVCRLLESSSLYPSALCSWHTAHCTSDVGSMGRPEQCLKSTVCCPSLPWLGHYSPEEA